MAAHTPGPWTTDEEIAGIWDSDGKPVMTAGPRVDPEAWANALLISAAPEMLDALRAGLAYCAALDDAASQPGRMSSFQTVTGATLDTLFEAWMSASRAAIASATGGRS